MLHATSTLGASRSKDRTQAVITTVRQRVKTPLLVCEHGEYDNEVYGRGLAPPWAANKRGVTLPGAHTRLN